MNIALWVAASVLAVVFLTTGIMKTARYQQDREKLRSIKGMPTGLVAFIGTCEIVGALGLILPAATGILPWLTPVAATGLALVMVLASGYHVARHESSEIGLTLALFVLAAFVAFGRFALVPLA
jgi:uncharacterized membrane protein YphA (DoxX/SURF4 family)